MKRDKKYIVTFNMRGSEKLSIGVRATSELEAANTVYHSFGDRCLIHKIEKYVKGKTCNGYFQTRRN